MIDAELESLRPPTGEGFSDSVTFSFADTEAELYGLARIGLVADSGQASALAIVFAGTEPVAARAQGSAPVAEPGWDAIEVAGVAARTAEPLRSWSVAFAGDGAGFELDFAALSPPLQAEVADGLDGYDHLCRVEGRATVAGREHEVSCLGQRGHGWGVVDWERIELARSVSAWLDDEHALTLRSVRPRGAESHGDETVRAVLLDPSPEGDAIAHEVAEPRLSTTYDGEGRQRRAGLELWVGEEDELPRRAAGQVACGTSLELGALRLDCAFFDWGMEGRAGSGRYDVLRRA